ncbi:hypothetical protein TrispH2_002601 [Trichoplax sp. H2]|nr:hypothetical protein TrispH2_002601 [Trichoplax sp. H2]|eukprot:RDD45465.1 hypothetical protein TrispH2_002601 [Trichoplax sp. H2]
MKSSLAIIFTLLVYFVVTIFAQGLERERDHEVWRAFILSKSREEFLTRLNQADCRITHCDANTKCPNECLLGGLTCSSQSLCNSELYH